MRHYSGRRLELIKGVENVTRQNSAWRQDTILNPVAKAAAFADFELKKRVRIFGERQCFFNQITNRRGIQVSSKDHPQNRKKRDG